MIPFTSEATAVGAPAPTSRPRSDVARWATALYGGDILDQATLASMVDVSPTQPYKPAAGPTASGSSRRPSTGQIAWGHRGHLDGFWSAM